MGHWGWKPYVPVAERRGKAQTAVDKARQAGKDVKPVVLATRTIAKTFWGKAWCDNLETYSDYENRLPRGRSYVRNSAVIDLKIKPGKIIAQVMGSSRYRVKIGITPLASDKWQKLVADCTGSIATLMELLQGKFSTAIMSRLCEEKTGLFPQPEEIQLDCSCLDWATMCKHVAAVLYGVGVRLDEQPELLFVLRQVDANDLLTAQAAELPTRAKKPAKAKVLDDAALADVFGIELATAEPAGEAAPASALGKWRTTAGKAEKTTAKPDKKAPAKRTRKFAAITTPTPAAKTKAVKKSATRKVMLQKDAE